MMWLPGGHTTTEWRDERRVCASCKTANLDRKVLEVQRQCLSRTHSHGGDGRLNTYRLLCRHFASDAADSAEGLPAKRSSTLMSSSSLGQ